VASYFEFAGFYDQIMGDRSEDIGRIRRTIERFMPGAQSLLELGCGTGAMLAGLADDLAVTGVDASPEMLAIAAGKGLGAHLVQADMTSFAFGTRFDVVICVFDTLNHLPKFESWLDLFDRVHEHLADGGLFAFDVNTTGRLRRLWRGPPFAHDFGPHTVIMDVAPAGGELSDWSVRIFEYLGSDLYQRHEEVIPELGVPLATIDDALSARFELLEQADIDGGIASDDSERVFFTYRKKATAGRPDRQP
jgi:SAM-dependent methyltransferase